MTLRRVNFSWSWGSGNSMEAIDLGRAATGDGDPHYET